MALKRPPPPPPTTDLVPGESPEDVHPIRLARILTEKWPALPAATRQVVLDELADGGISLPAAGPPPGPSPASPGIEKFVTLPPGSEADADYKMEIMRAQLRMAGDPAPVPLVELLSLLSDLTGHAITMGEMLNSVGAVWQNLSKNKRARLTPGTRLPLLDCLREALHPDPAGELQPALKDQVEAVRLLLYVLLGVSRGGQEFADALCRHFDPDKLYQELRRLAGRAPTAEELWNFYTKRSNALTRSEIEDRLFKCMVDAVDTLYNAARSG